MLAADGVLPGHPSRVALGAVETVAMGAEIVFSEVNERSLGRLATALEDGRPGRLFRLARRAVLTGLALRLAPGRRAWAGHVTSGLFLAAGLAYRFAWVGAGRTSAADDEAVALTARHKRV